MKLNTMILNVWRILVTVALASCVPAHLKSFPQREMLNYETAREMWTTACGRDVWADYEHVFRIDIVSYKWPDGQCRLGRAGTELKNAADCVSALTWGAPFYVIQVSEGSPANIWAHEMGHAMGLQHTPQGSGSLMDPVVTKDATVTSSDIEALRALGVKCGDES